MHDEHLLQMAIAEMRRKRRSSAGLSADEFFLRNAKLRSEKAARADFTINELPAGATPQGADLFPIFRPATGLTEYLTWTQLLAGVPPFSIAGYPSGSPAQNTDLLVISRGGVIENVTAQSVAALFAAGTSRIFNIVTYGAIGNGVFVCNTAIANAIAACAAAGGGVVYFPAGNWRITNSINLAGMGSPSRLYGMRFVGDAQGSSCIYADAGTYDIFAGGAYPTAANNLANFSWQNLNFLCNNGNMSGGAMWRIPFGVNIWISDCTLQAHFHTLDVGDAMNNAGSVTTLFMSRIDSYNQFGDFLRTRTRSAQFFINQCMVRGSGPSYDAGTSNAVALISAGSLTPGFDLIDMQDCDFESIGQGLNFNATLGDLSDSYFADCFFDGTTNSGLTLQCGTGAPGYGNIRLMDCTFWTGHPPFTGGGVNAATIAQSGTGPIHDVLFVACTFQCVTGGNGLDIGTSQAIKFHSCNFHTNAVGIGVHLQGGGNLPVTTEFRNCSIGNDIAGGQNLKGVVIDSATVNGVIFENNYIAGNTTNWTDNSTTRLGQCRYRNNIGPNPFGPPTNPAQPAIAATTVVVANPYATDCIVYVTGNGAANLTAHVNGSGGSTAEIPILSTATVSAMVPAGSGIALTYTAGAPTWIWMLL